METNLKDSELIDIEKELIKLRDAQIGEKKIRSALFTLIIYAKKDPHLEELQTLAKSVISCFPCRILFVINDPEGADFVKTSVSLEGLGKNYLNYCEQIKIEVAGAYCESSYYLALPHFLSDLPIYLLWTDQFSLNNTFFTKISPHVSRVIIDSDPCKDLKLYSDSLLSFMKTSCCNCGDLNWSALFGWRLIFHHLFSSQEMIFLLSEPKTIKITYEECGGKSGLIEAFFFASWIASSLNWQIKSSKKQDRTIHLHFQFQDFSPTITLMPENALLKTISVCEIESKQNNARVVLKRRPNSRQIVIQYSDSERCILPYTTFLAGNEEGREIIDEIFHPSNPKPFQEMLEMVLKICKTYDQKEFF